MSSILDETLPEPSFIDRDPNQVTTDIVALYESLTGKTLFPAQVERLLINTFSYRESLLRQAIQDAAKQNLVRYARAPVLDMLGENVDTQRIGATPATCTLQFTFDAAQNAAVIPAGTQVGSDVLFSTSADIDVSAGATTAQTTGTCTVAGTANNGFVAGQISGLVGTVAGLNITAAQNIDTTANGTDDEQDDPYRERIVLAPDSFSVAGPADAYTYWARSVSAAIVDVQPVYPALALNAAGTSLVSTNQVPPGCVYLYVLTSSGPANADLLAQVLAACTPNNRRPCTDFVQTQPVQEVDYQIVAELTLLENADEATAISAATSAVSAYTTAREQSLGADIVQEQIVGILNGVSSYGVYKVNLIQPAADQVLDVSQWGRCTGITISAAGTAQG